MKRLMVVLFAAVSLVAVAEGPKGKAPQRPGPTADPILKVALDPKMAEKLELTSEQAAKLKEIADSRKGAKELNEKIRKGMKAQSELLEQQPIDEAKVMAAIDEVFEARKELAKVQTKRLIAVKTVLTTEQVKKAREEFRNMRKPEKKPGAPKPKAEPTVE